MVLSTPIPILIAATVTVIISSGMPDQPIIPRTLAADNKLGIMAIRAI